MASVQWGSLSTLWRRRWRSGRRFRPALLSSSTPPPQRRPLRRGRRRGRAVVAAAAAVAAARLLVLLLFGATVNVANAGRFASHGPVLTVTVKDPTTTTTTTNTRSNSRHSKGGESLPLPLSWLDALQPAIAYSVASSQQPPLPNWLPSLRSVATGVGYQHHHPRHQSDDSNNNNNLPDCWFESTLKFDVPTIQRRIVRTTGWAGGGGGGGGNNSSPRKYITFGYGGDGQQLTVQHAHQLATGTTSLHVQTSRGPHYAQARWAHSSRPYDAHAHADRYTTTTTMSPSNGGAMVAADTYSTTSTSTIPRSPRDDVADDDDGDGRPALPLLQSLRGSVLWHKVPLAAVASIRVTPAVDFVCRTASCSVQAVAGGQGRTVATLRYAVSTARRRNNHDDKYSNSNNNSSARRTLAVQYQLPDGRNWIRPVLDLATGKMTYQWILALGSGGGGDVDGEGSGGGGGAGGSSLLTTVDPASAITCTWTDQSGGGGRGRSGGAWVTDVRVPLRTKVPLRQWTADVRVRRQFRF